MSRKSREERRRRLERPRQQPPPVGASSEYRRNVGQADDILAKEAMEIRPDNWQQLALDWFAPQEPERGELTRYIADHEQRLGIPWARELLRLEVFFDGRAFDSEGEALIKTLTLLRSWQSQPRRDGRTILDIVVTERNQLLARRARILKARLGNSRSRFV